MIHRVSIVQERLGENMEMTDGPLQWTTAATGPLVWPHKFLNICSIDTRPVLRS